MFAVQELFLALSLSYLMVAPGATFINGATHSAARDISLSIFFLVCGMCYQCLLHATVKLMNFGEIAGQLDKAHRNYGAEILAAILIPLVLITVPSGLGLAIAYGLAKLAK